VKAFLAILKRELAERRLLLAGAAFAGLFPLLAPWLARGDGQSSADLRGGTALGLAVIASSLLALILGSTVIASDLSERRLGFYFARPLPGWTIWAGKMSGAALLSVGAGALILLPALLAGGRIDATGLLGFSGFAAGAALVAGVLLLLLASHAVSVMVRSRSVWLAADLVALALVGLAVWACGRELWKEGALTAILWGQQGITVSALVALAVAGLVQVVRGRTDLRQGHRLLSLTLWALMGGAALGHAAYAAWVLRVAPEDLVSIQGIMPAPSGSWIVVTGHARGRSGYAPTFLLDAESGRSLKLPSSGERYWGHLPLVFDREGGRAVQLEPIGEGRYRLLLVDLRSPEPVLRRTDLIYSSDPRLALSPDGRRVAALADGRLTVEDLDTGRLLAAVAMEAGFEDRLRFLGPDRVRIFQSSQVDEPGMPEVWRLTTLDLDIPSRRIVLVSRIELPGKGGIRVVSPDGRRAILRQEVSEKSVIVDLETGRFVPLPDPASPTSFLSDGRMLETRRVGERSFLGVLAPDGKQRLRIPLPGYRLQIGGLLAPDLFVIATAPRGATLDDEAAWASWLIDLRTGGLRQIGSGIVPVSGFPWLESSFTRLFLRGDRELVRLDPATGQLRTVLRLSS
jgi:hypothetical protein